MGPMVSPVTETRTWRPVIMGRAAVASNHPAATQAGLDVLRRGGSAADAAVTISLCLGVAEPFMSGLGGDGFLHVHEGHSSVYEGTGAAPAAASLDLFGGVLPEDGPLSISPPGLLAALGRMHRKHGRLPFQGLVAPAAEMARVGTYVGHTYRRYAKSDKWRLNRSPDAVQIYFDQGEVPGLGSKVINRKLAETLDEIGRSGVDEFYRGALARRIVTDLKAAGSIITDSDLRDVQAIGRDAISAQYRGYEVLQTPPVSTGFVLLQELAILEQFPPKMLLENPSLRIHVMIEAKKLSFLDREKYGGDPSSVYLPVSSLLDPVRIANLADRISLGKAADLPIHIGGSETNTTYFCAADDQGQVVSAIQSLNAPFGSGVFLASTGILMNNRMTCWHLDRDHPNALMPKKRVRQTMNAPIILKDGLPWAALGTPGADNQVQVNFQAITSLIDLELDPQQTAEAPRWSSDQPGQGANWPHGGENTLVVEASFDPTILQGLRDRGHSLKVVPGLEGPCSLEIIRILPDGTKLAGSDPRRDGWAAAIG